MALTDNLQAFYKLSDTSDSSGNNRTLTNNGNVSFASGKIGNAAVFDSSNYLYNSNNPLVGANSFTISCWLKTLASGGYEAYGAVFIGFSDTATLWLDGTGHIVLDATSGGSARLQTEGTYNDGQWHHIVGKYDGSAAKVFVDNVEIGSLETSVLPNWKSNFSIGGEDGFWKTDKEIDAVGIWNRALSDAEVAELYNNGTGLELPAPTGPAIKNGWIDGIFWINDVATTLDQNGDGTWVGKLYENGSLFSGTKYELTFVDGVAQPVQVVTVTGNDVPVAFGLNEQSEPLVQLVFASITNAGETTVEQIVPTVMPAGIPAQYTVAQTVLAYSIDTTATFEGTINVDFILPSNTSQTVFNRMKGFHVKNNGTVEEMARVSSDFSTKRITVAITSFSSFLFLDEPQVNKSVKVIGKSKFVGKIKFA
jgi:hypothetical protein